MDPIIDYRTGQSVALTASRFMTRIYGWMTFGLLITAVVAYVIGNDPMMMQTMMANRGVMYLLFFMQLGIVFGLSAAINRISVGTATFLFLLYSFLNGITFSALFMMYSINTLGQTFGITAGAFAGLAFYGSVTKRDLSAMGTFMVMGLWGIIIASLVNMFMHSAAVDTLVSYAGVLIFSGLTAWDTQKLKTFSRTGQTESDEGHKVAIIGALMLYLDFINLFIFLLRIFGNGSGGRRRDY